MTNRIKVLDEHVINRIAAGEVIERPVSVVKELVENSIDAESSSISVHVESGGKKLIMVRDDGRGISHDDAFLALERHATSKINTENDLLGISTMGFRGEALAAIAAISKFTLKSSDGSEQGGQEVIAEGGVLKSAKPVGMPKGTIIEVRNLFYNVPVRRKFLRKNDLEEAHISEMMTKFALGFPWIGFKYVVNNRTKMEAAPASSTFERINSLYSKDVRDNLLELDHSYDEVSIQGYVARPPYSRSNNRSVLTFVNGRSVKDGLINSAVNRAFSNLMERGRYPLAILFLQIPPDRVDINVHPQKAEVRFVDPQKVYKSIIDGVQDALCGGPFRDPPHLRKPFFPQKPENFQNNQRDDDKSNSVQSSKNSKSPMPGISQNSGPVMKDVSQSRARSSMRKTGANYQRQDKFTRANKKSVQADDSAFSGKYPPTQADKPNEYQGIQQISMVDDRKGSFSDLGIVGQLPNSFIILHDERHLLVMDHHAAHERVLFEDLMAAWNSGGAMPSQTLLIPRVAHFDPVESKSLSEHLDVLNKAGFIIEDFGENAFSIRGIPPWIDVESVEAALQEIIDVIMESGVKGDSDRIKEESLRALACSSAAKESKSMDHLEIRSLLKNLDRIGAIEVCPHGRPILVRYELSEIRRKLGRT